jgi:hypothetical protein
VHKYREKKIEQDKNKEINLNKIKEKSNENTKKRNNYIIIIYFFKMLILFCNYIIIIIIIIINDFETEIHNLKID